jgi:glycosyltransferase involved in cell wall biosynthesis
MNTEKTAHRCNSEISIVLVSDTVYDANGVSRFIQDAAAIALRSGMRFTVLTSSPLASGKSAGNIINAKPLLAVRMPFFKEQSLTLLPPFLTLFREIKRLRPDVLHISTPGPIGFSALCVAKLLHIPTAGTYHTDFPAYLENHTQSRTVGRITRALMRLFYRRMGLVFSRSLPYLPILHEEIKIPSERTAYLKPGTDLQRFSPLHRDPEIWRNYGIAQESVKLLYVGRLSKEKNFLFVVSCFKALQQQSVRKVELVVLGEGELSKSEELKECDAIHLLGVKRGEELSALYATSDLFVFASTTETLGQAVMEAQASGLACIVSDQGGVKETVKDRCSGFTISVDDQKRWVRELSLLVENDWLRLQMGENGRELMKGRSIEGSFRTFVKYHEAMLEAWCY